jgi:hypothetical protein
MSRLSIGEIMAGSKRAFAYTTDAGSTVAVVADESNVEAVNGALAVAPLAGSILSVDAEECRYARYVNVALGVVRLVIVVSNAALAVLPAILNFWVQTGGTTGSVQPFALAATRGETFRRYAGGDSGLTDGDVP